MLHQRISADGRALKTFAVITMLIDHVTCCFLEVARGTDGKSIMYSFSGGETLDIIGRGIGRSAFPIFCFMLVEGFLYTHSRGKYFARLLLFAAVSYFPFKWIFFPYTSRPHADVIFTLALGFLMIWGIESMAKKLLPCADNTLARRILEVIPARKAKLRDEHVEGHGVNKLGNITPEHAEDSLDELSKVCLEKDRNTESEHTGSGHGIFRTAVFVAGSVLLTAVLCFAAEWARSDYSYGGVLVILMMYLLYRHRGVSLISSYVWLSFYNGSEVLSVPGFWLIWCYNGKRGRQNKYFFYIFYPAHLLILYLIRRTIFGR